MIRRVLRILAVGAVVTAVAVGVPMWDVARGWADEGVALADQHARHEVAHPGWSFPARVRTAEVPVKGASPKRLVAEARARGYREDCVRTGPGEFCAKPGKERVVPRSGASLEPIDLGVLLGPDGELREHLPLARAPKVLIDAIVSAEDRDFREHGGVNWTATARAALANAQERGYAQGASTLTMQVVRNLGQRKEKTLTRKLREMVTALAIDDHLGKDGVLQMYLDAPYLGQWGSVSICGFRAAARHYFGKDATDLTLAEAATLAAILPAPGKFAPDKHPELAKEKRDRVLHAMAELYGYDVAEALAEPVATVAPSPLPNRYPAYLGATRAWLEQELGPDVLYGAGLQVTVAMDVAAQEETEALFPKKTAWFESALIGKKAGGALQAAAVLLDVETGAVQAIYGGADATSISFNRATQARRQPGSSFKPLTYALAFEQRDAAGKPRFTSASTEPNSPRVFKTPQGNWSPRNVGGEYSATAALAYGLAWSQNIATAGLLEELGGAKVLKDFATRLGFQTKDFREEMGLCLGQAEVTPLEMAQFAATVANGGRLVKGSPVLSAVDAAGVPRVSPPRAGEQVLSPGAAALTRELMRLVIEIGTGGASRGAGGEAGYAGQAMGKTGTTDREKDLWFVGSTPSRAGAVWLGYDVPAPLGLAASDLAAPLWGWWMHRVTAGDGPAPTFPEEPRIVYRGVCGETGRSPNASCRGIRAPFLEGEVPKIGGCSLEHPPPEEEPAEGEEPLDGAEGAPKKKKHESVWKKMAREKAEREAAKAE